MQVAGVLFDAKGPTAVYEKNHLLHALGLMNSIFVEKVNELLNPTLSFQLDDFYKIPVNNLIFEDTRISNIVEQCISTVKDDWNAYETSWEFTILPLLQKYFLQTTLQDTYRKLRSHWQEMTIELQRLEKKNNQIIIKAYGLEDELTPEVPLRETTLTCNPHYRYLGKNSDEKLEALLQADTMKEFIS